MIHVIILNIIMIILYTTWGIEQEKEIAKKWEEKRKLKK